jgi:Protein of unknown function (DUF2946)
MTWVRSNIKCFSRIALLALLVQFALSFGHFHAIASVPASTLEVSSAQSALSHTDNLAAEAADIQSARQPESDHRSDKHSADTCAICAVMAMADTALFGMPPVLPLPQRVEAAHLTAREQFARVASASVAFRPRAPPIP